MINSLRFPAYIYALFFLVNRCYIRLLFAIGVGGGCDIKILEREISKLF